MVRNTILVGNGLGMALDPIFFTLDRAIEEVWNLPNRLTAVQKDQIKQCVSVQGINDRPHGEDHLDVLHLAVIACKFLDEISNASVTWLSNDGQTFPFSIEKFITSVSWHFHHYPGLLPQNFTDSLVTYIRQTRSHVATLNYDNLLYQTLISAGILNGYDGELVDGIHATGFHADNLVRLYDRTFGYYLHLHGSPLFINAGNTPIKQNQGAADEDISTPHIVLTHVKHKKSVIANSYLLTTYWQYLELGLRESDKVILFGYSGYDTHLNQVIGDNIIVRNIEEDAKKEVVVIEWSGAGSAAQRKVFWIDQLKTTNIQLIQMGNILDFTDWDNV